MTSVNLLELDAESIERSEVVDGLIARYRREADAFLFLAGGAAKMSGEAKARLLDVLRSTLGEVANSVRLAVGDGGTKAGLMEAAGQARHEGGDRFLLLGVCPAPEVLPVTAAGRTPVEPNHSDVIAIHDREWAAANMKRGWDPSQGFWGSEVRAAYQIFGHLAEGKPSAALVANGGGITLDEVEWNMRQRRPVVVLAGSGRAADAIVSLLEQEPPRDQEVRNLREKAERIGVADQRDGFRVVRLDEAAVLPSVLLALLRPGAAGLPTPR